jgi:hypothetical protein
MDIAVLEFHLSGFPIPGKDQITPGHQRMSLSSKHDAGNDSWARTITPHTPPIDGWLF